MKLRPVVVVVTLTVFFEVLAAAIVIGMNSALWLLGAAALHLVAARLALSAARMRRPDLSRVEADAVIWTSVLVPLFGPTISWSAPLPPQAEEVENAHSVFERYSDLVKADTPDYERTLFTGDYDRDLARELDAESYNEVLRGGSIDQKRNALRRLAERGEAKHFALIRRCLLDPSHEVRLYAYSELERSGRIYEEEIAKRSRQLKQNPGEKEALLALARAHFEYAESGIHDEEMAAFYFRTAERYGGRIEGPEAAWVRARALSRVGEFDAAQACLDGLTEAEWALPESCVARADIAFRRRDFATARAEAERLAESGAEIPEWLRALEAKA